MALSGCGAGNYPEPVMPAAVNRTYEKVDPSPAVTADFYDLSLKIDTENDRLSEKVSIDIQNNTDSPVDEEGHSWFYDAVGNNEYNEGWIDEGIVSYLASHELVLNEIESYNTEKKYGSDWTLKDQTNALKQSSALIEENNLKPLDHCYLNTSWYDCPEGFRPGDTEYMYTPFFLVHAKEIMGEEAFYSFLREVYQTYAMKVVHSEDILKILRKYDNSSEMNQLVAFYFDESQE